MKPRLFHIFRNTPFGRETMLQSLYFCKMVNCEPIVYIPEFTKFLIYFDNDVVQVDLDRSYLESPETAVDNVSELIKGSGFEPKFFSSENKTASNLPDIPSDFDYMCCPRSISDLSSKIGLGFIGSRVRTIVQSARFPVLIPGNVFKPWESISVFFGGSKNSINAVRLGLTIAENSGKPFRLVTFKEKNQDRESYRQILKKESLLDLVESRLDSWDFFEKEKMDSMLFKIPHDSILVLGAYGHGIIKDMIFGSVMEKIQSIMPNNILVAGPLYLKP